MSRPLMHLCAQSCSIFSRGLTALSALVLIAAASACSNPASTDDGSAVAEGDGTGDTDVKIHDTKDTKGPETEVDTTDDVELPDGTDLDTTDAIDGDGLIDTTDDVDAGDVDALTDAIDGGDTDILIGTDVAIDIDVVEEISACEFPQAPLKGTAGASCTTNDECDFGYCVDTPDGKVCTRQCTNTCCPGGWGCKNVAQAGDPVYGCVPNLVHSCDPCTDDSQCHSPGDTTGLCLSYGDSGNFCGGTCATGLDAECPLGYYCLKNAKGTANGVSGAGGSGNQCMKKSGACECSNQAKALGLSTNCTSKNKYGACSGGRQCQPSGLTGCDAKSPTAEVCNGLDDNCDGATDEAGASLCTTFWKDSDKDGFGNSPATGGENQCLCKALDLFSSTSPTDCDDTNNLVKPSAAEICDGIDNDCNGKTDETCDEDKDGYCDATAVIVGKTKACKYVGADCDDGNPKIHPGQPEICGNNIDDDCDGYTDSGATDAVGCNLFYEDGDKDGVGTFNSQCLCAPAGIFTATIGGDCDDTKANVSPVAVEVCDALDNDCNGIIDDPGAQGCVMAFKDADGDGYGDPATKACVCGLAMPYNTFKGDDCDDKLSLVFPGAKEKCNGIDDNCDKQIDEENADGCTVYYSDSDFDGIGNTAKAKCLCAKTGAYSTTKPGDCNDSDPTIKPGNAETCDGKDNDCDGIDDHPNAIGCVVYYADSDNDNYGDVATSTKCLCSADGIWKVLQGGDCQDKNNGIHPGVAEKCDGIDNDCDGLVDPPNSIGCSNFYPDFDNDGYGDMYASNWACQCGPLYPNTSTQQNAKDCNDKNPLVSPGAFEICGDGIDNNCNGLTDEPTTNTMFYVDVDGDGYGTGAGQSLCKPSTVNGQFFSASQAGDCNDALKEVHPNAAESCNGIDDDCNGKTDEQLPSVMCGDAVNGTPSCVGGKCIPQCYASWFDADGIASNGCECKADNFYGILGDSCISPVDLGYIYDDGGATVIKTGNIMPGEPGDWFHFKAIDSNDASGSCDPFNVHVWLSGNPDGQFTVDLYKHSCGGTSLLCSNEADTGWTVAFSGKPPYGPQTVKGTVSGVTDPSPIPEMGGECKCVNGTSLPGMNQCTDNSADFYVRVGRYPGTGTICQNYTLTITNGQ